MDKNIIIIDDEQNLTYFLKEGLKKDGYLVQVANTLSEGKALIEAQLPDLLILDLNLPDGNGLEFYQEMKEKHDFIPTVILTAHSSVRSAIDAIKMGIDDYIAKPFDIKELSVLVGSLFKRYHLKNQLNYYRRKAQCSQDFDFFVSNLPAIKEHQQMAMKIAEFPVSTILIEGATGTGKEMLARFIHNNSAQADAPFVEINCASLPANLLESELFGYEPGAFTGARKRKIGLIELAEGGTLFLDEIGELSLPLQAKLLPFLENHSFKRLGGLQDLKVQLRVIAATNRDIELLVNEKLFRQDLFFRLNIFRIKLPPLQQRKEEILLLAQFFLEKLNNKMNRKIKYFSSSSKKIIMEYDWPGNIRELHNVLERAVILSNSDLIDAEHFPHEIRDTDSNHKTFTPKLSDLGDLPLKDFFTKMEFNLLMQALELGEGNQVKTARLLNEPRHIVRYLLKKHSITSK